MFWSSGGKSSILTAALLSGVTMPDELLACEDDTAAERMGGSVVEWPDVDTGRPARSLAITL